jgi:hypothetical protein
MTTSLKQGVNERTANLFAFWRAAVDKDNEPAGIE